MKLAVVIARVLLGIPFVVFGLNGFLGFLPQPETTPEAAAFLQALADTGYMDPVREIFEIGAGVLLIFGLYVPLALTLLAPILVNILGFHVALDGTGLPVALLLVVFELFLAWMYRDAFRSILSARSRPAIGGSAG